MNGKCPDYKSISLVPSRDTPPEIPQKLIVAGFRFIKIGPKSKLPTEKGWSKTRNYEGADPAITTWLHHAHNYEAGGSHFEGFGNYGVLGSETGIIVDLDSQEIQSFLLERSQTLPDNERLPNTLMVKSGSGRGMHLYFRTSGAYPVRLLNPQDPDENFGDIQAAGKFVVGPSSIHKSGNRYEIVNDVEIAFVDFETLLKFFEPFVKKEPRKEVLPERRIRLDNLEIDIPIEKILYPEKPVNMGGGEIRGSHPLHGSTGGRNFAINTVKNTWFCNRHQSGGGPMEAIAIKHGLIDCADAHPGCLRGDTFTQALDIAEEEYGWVRPVKTTPPRPKILPEPHVDEPEFIIDDVPTTHDETIRLPGKLPEGAQAVLVNAYPRIGKSHWSEIQAIWHQTANIIANTHSVIEQHLRIFRENRKPGQTAVHLEGRNRCCLFPDEGRTCKKCNHYPYTSDPADRGRFLAFVDNSLHEMEIVTKHEVPEGNCPYFFLKEAAKLSDYVFTVPENLEEITGDTHQKRHLTIMDEDTVFASFFPQSADLAEFTRGPTRSHVSSTLESKWIGIQKWKDYIARGKRPKGKDTIIAMIRVLEQIREILRIKDDEVFSTGAIANAIKDIDTNIPMPTDTTVQELIRNIERFEISDTFSVYAKALLFPYKKRQFAWQGYNPMKLRMIADEEKRIFDPPDTKMILIGSTRAELFLKTLDIQWKVINIDKFRYSKNFLFIVLKEEVKQGQSKKRSYKHCLTTALKHVSHVNDDIRYPLLILTGTKREQHTVMETLGGICKGSSDENITGQKWNYIGGFFNVIYQNSVISRGVDIPFYKCLAVYSSDFASPYWSTRRDVALEEGNREDALHAQSIIDAITIDETTNSTLRITPTVNHSDDIPRVVIIGERDLWKIKPGVTAEAQMVYMDADQLFNNIGQALDVTGRMELLPERTGLVYDENNIEYEGTAWFATTFHQQPEIMLGKTVEDKCRFLAEILKTKSDDIEPWRKKINPKLVEKIEKDVIDYLVRRWKEKKTSKVGVVQNWLIGRNKRITQTLCNKILISMYRSNKVRIDGIGLNGTIYLPSTYHEPEKSDVKNDVKNEENTT